MNTLKNYGRVAKFTELTQGSKINKDTKRKEEGIFEKWELVSSHICRSLVPLPQIYMEN